MRSALLYPSILVVSGITAVLLVFVFVVPQFSNLLEDGNELPLLSEAVLRAGVWFNAHWWWLVGALAAGAAFGAALARQPAVRQRVRDVLAALPVLGGWLAEVDTAKWASVMGAMLTSRVELMDALGLASRGVRTSRRRAALEQVTGDVRGGTALSAALEKRGALTPTGYNLLRVGEQSGQLAEMLRALAALYEENSTRRMKQLLTLVEPMAILLLGGFLGVIMIGSSWPLPVSTTSHSERPVRCRARHAAQAGKRDGLARRRHRLRRKTRLEKSAGFTLIELMVVLVILGLLAGLVGPRLFGKVDQSKVQTAQTQIKMLRGALQVYRLDIGRYPTTAQGLAALMRAPQEVASFWSGPYLEDELPLDSVAHALSVRIPGRQPPGLRPLVARRGLDGGRRGRRCRCRVFAGAVATPEFRPDLVPS